VHRWPTRSHSAVAVTGVVFAHASGFSWDEALLVMLPILVIGGLLAVANARAKKLQDGFPDGEPVDEDEPSDLT
jgi:uncharacterized membrane protein